MLSHQQLHLTPRRLDYQTTQAHEAVIKPAPTQQRDIIDAFGNPVTEIAIEAAHTSLDIIAQSTVTVIERRLIDAGENTRLGDAFAIASLIAPRGIPNRRSSRPHSFSSNPPTRE